MSEHGRAWLARAAALLFLSIALFCGMAVAAPQTARADGGAPNLAYVAGGGSGGNDLVVIDIGKRAVTGRVAVGGGPASALLSTDGRYAYVAQSTKNAVAIVDARTLQVVATVPVGPTPQGMALDLSRSPNLLYVANSGSDTLTMLDPDARKVVASVTVGKHPTGVAVAAIGSGIAGADLSDAEIYVANSGDDTVTVLSARHRTTIATIPVSGGPLNVVVPASGGVAYVGTRSGAVVALDLATHKVLGTLLRRHGPIGVMDYDGVTGQIYVPDAASSAVVVLRPAAPAGGGAAQLPSEPLRTYSFSGGPAAAAITFDGAYGFVAEQSAGRVTMLDAPAHTTLTTMAVGGHPRSIITGSYPPLVGRQGAAVAAVVAPFVLVAVLIVATLLVIRASRRAKARAKGGAA
jgi:YVTN family beta-propeller protein